MDTKRLVGIGTGLAVVGGGILLKTLLVIGGSEVAGSVADHANDAKRDDTGAVVKAGRLDAISLRAGDCWQDGALASTSDAMSDVGEVAVVPCSTTHNAQVVAVPTHDGTYPSSDTTTQWCSDALTTWFSEHKPAAKKFLDTEPDAGIAFVIPSESDWEADGQNAVVCSVEAADEALDYLFLLS